MSLFVAIEGIDGAGTTTQTKLVAEALTARGLVVHQTKEPSERAIGKLLRQELAAKTLPEAAMALLFAADRLDHYDNEIAPALKRGEVVLSDRYVLSSLVYQGATLGEWPLALNAKAIAPELTVLIEVPAQVAAYRRAARLTPAERYDDNQLQAKLVQRYAELAPSDALRVDGTEPPAEICAAITRAISETIDAKNTAAKIKK